MTKTRLTAVAAAAASPLVLCPASQAQQSDLERYNALVQSVAGRVCYEQHADLALGADARKSISLVETKIDQSNLFLVEFQSAARQVVKEIGDDRTMSRSAGYELYAVPTAGRPIAGRELAAGVLCEHGRTTGCRNRNYYFERRVGAYVIAEIVVRETLKDAPLVTRCK